MVNWISFYLVVCFILSILHVYTGVSIAFSYHEYFKISDILLSIPIFALLLASITLGSYFGSRLSFRNFKLNSFKIKYFHILGFAFLIYFCASIFFTILGNSDQSNDGEMFRVLESKTSQIFLILSGIVLVYNFNVHKLTKSSYILAFAISSSFALVDGSRAALLPFFLLCFWLFSNGYYWKLAINMCTLVIIVGLLFYGRILTRGLTVEFDNVLGFLSYILSQVSISYFTSFSWLHFIYSIDHYKFSFSVIDLFYSVTPIPSRFLPYEPNTSEWRIDRYRPIGAQGSLFISGIIPFILFNFCVGFANGQSNRVQKPVIKTLVKFILLFTFASSFQYNLRSIQWFFWCAVLIMVLTRLNNKYNRGKT